MADLGRRNKLRVLRNSVHGLYLDGGEDGEILLPKRYTSPNARRGEQLEVFVYRDSQDRLVATTEIPRAEVGEIASLRVVGVNERVGAFLDWGLAKDLLLPFREQVGEVKVGDEVAVRLYLDQKTDRIAASMKLKPEMASEPPDFRPGQPVDLVLIERTELGFKVRVEGAHQGLLYHDRLTQQVKTGQKLKGYVRTVRPDGKIDVSLDAAGYRRVAPLALRIVDRLKAAGGRLPFDDDSPPEAIRETFGASKKAFKQALGSLYKSRRIRFVKPGIELCDNTTWEPGRKD